MHAGWWSSYLSFFSRHSQPRHGWMCLRCEVGGEADICLDSGVSLVHIECQLKLFSLWQEHESIGVLDVVDLSMLGLSCLSRPVCCRLLWLGFVGFEIWRRVESVNSFFTLSPSWDYQSWNLYNVCVGETRNGCASKKLWGRFELDVLKFSCVYADNYHGSGVR